MNNAFDEEQMMLLRRIPAVRMVSPSRIYYTNTFRNEFRRRVNAGESPRAVFEAAGLGPQIIGAKRIERCAERWMRGGDVPEDRPAGARRNGRGAADCAIGDRGVAGCGADQCGIADSAVAGDRSPRVLARRGYAYACGAGTRVARFVGDAGANDGGDVNDGGGTSAAASHAGVVGTLDADGAAGDNGVTDENGATDARELRTSNVFGAVDSAADADVGADGGMVAGADDEAEVRGTGGAIGAAYGVANSMDGDAEERGALYGIADDNAGNAIADDESAGDAEDTVGQVFGAVSETEVGGGMDGAGDSDGCGGSHECRGADRSKGFTPMPAPYMPSSVCHRYSVEAVLLRYRARIEELERRLDALECGEALSQRLPS
ncbi:HTH domain-containing protein [Bifidobacterium avesanii]|uniref:Uncharacterized protein n=1 Tax=Bifidobacterium avesanii TaxID=1798157 RepID=A0A7K3TIK3_9BIFI|nr:HTH domain-containing protein [Bifidobacterium avesanii]KAB8290944.1 hypothetical protein DSM100685_1348 [Bifidobacterium avesanii]NEG78902.1 hypothetical protein [Bifidobacterium avesanii]